jgi:hypothetical protein
MSRIWFTPSARFFKLALQGSVSITGGIDDREKVVYTPVRFCGSTTMNRGARSSVKNGHKMILCEVFLIIL